MAEPLGVSFQAVQKYETGNIRISASTLYRLAQVLGVELGYFFEGFGTPEPAKRKRPHKTTSTRTGSGMKPGE